MAYPGVFIDLAFEFLAFRDVASQAALSAVLGDIGACRVRRSLIFAAVVVDASPEAFATSPVAGFGARDGYFAAQAVFAYFGAAKAARLRRLRFGLLRVSAGVSAASGAAACGSGCASGVCGLSVQPMAQQMPTMTIQRLYFSNIQSSGMRVTLTRVQIQTRSL